MPVLGLDTATSRGSVALARGAVVAAEAELSGRGGHAHDLLESIDRLLRAAEVGPHDLVAVGVAAGPGSFTGVRVGIATAKGLAYALGIGLLAISTLEAMARAALHLAPHGGVPICPVIQTGRHELYAALFIPGPGGLVRGTPDRLVRPEELAREIPPGTLLLGDGASRVPVAPGEAARAIQPAPLLAPAIAVRAGAVLAGNAGYRPGEAIPNYVRLSDAEAARRRS